MAEKQAKIGEKQESMAETNQKWQKTDKNDRKTFKMWSITNYLPPSFPFLSCQAPISVLPSSLFCPAKLINFSRGGPRPPRPPPPKYAYGIESQTSCLGAQVCCGQLSWLANQGRCICHSLAHVPAQTLLWYRTVCNQGDIWVQRFSQINSSQIIEMSR